MYPVPFGTKLKSSEGTEEITSFNFSVLPEFISLNLDNSLSMSSKGGGIAVTETVLE
jgi:hypothetical protein